MRIQSLLAISLLALASLAAQAPASLPPGTRISAELKTKLDTKHASVGEAVLAVTTSDVKEHGVKLLPKGSRLSGQITEVVTAETSKSPSRLSLRFDQATTKQGHAIPLHAAIVAVDLPRIQSNAMMNANASGPIPAPDTSSDSGRPSMTIGGDTGPPPQMTQANPEMSSMTEAANGAQIRAIPSAVGGSITSSRGDLHLDSGTRLELQVQH